MSGTFQISSSPVDAIMPGAMLMVGVEDDEDGSTKVYVGAMRHRIHFHMADADAEKVKEVWAGGHSHLWIRGLDVDQLCGCEQPKVEDTKPIDDYQEGGDERI